MIKPWLAFLLSVVVAMAAPSGPASAVAPRAPVLRDGVAIVAAARAQVGVTVSYDPVYRRLAYPGGDVPPATGVCADVIVRALRSTGRDLQKLVHEDMVEHFDAYPKNWGLRRADANIDHRRVPNLMVWFTRSGWAKPVVPGVSDYAAGDIVTWNLPRGLRHIGVVSDRKSADGTPLVIHNIGAGAREEDVLRAWPVSGRFRAPAAVRGLSARD